MPADRSVLSIGVRKADRYTHRSDCRENDLDLRRRKREGPGHRALLFKRRSDGSALLIFSLATYARAAISRRTRPMFWRKTWRMLSMGRSSAGRPPGRLQGPRRNPAGRRLPPQCLRSFWDRSARIQFCLGRSLVGLTYLLRAGHSSG
jgi:hypothetical protein